MMVVAAADIATQSPLSDYPSGRFMIGLAHAAGTVMSISSGREIIDQLNQSLAVSISPSAELNNQ
jgi:hypothetical protein